MNHIKLSGKIISAPKYKPSLGVVEFKLKTEEECVNHKTGKLYNRSEVHTIVYWGKAAMKVNNVLVPRTRGLHDGVEAIVEGSLRKRVKGAWTTWGGDRQLPTEEISIEANTIKIPVKVKNQGQLRDIITGKF